MSFENQIQQWVSLDNQLKQLNEKTKDLREKRNTLEEKITIFIKIALQILTKALITETLHFESRENQGDQIWRFYK